MHNLVLVCILRWNHRIRLSDLNAEDALQILVSTSMSELQLSCTTLPRYWKWDTVLMGSSEGESRMASGNWLYSVGKTAKDLVFLQLMVSPKSLQCAANELSMAVRSSHLSDRRAMSSAYCLLRAIVSHDSLNRMFS